MRKTLCLPFLILLLSMTSCVIVPVKSSPANQGHQEGHVPPGQAKKETGSKSAKPYAPGQQKKKK
jgi:hypothetical protein